MTAAKKTEDKRAYLLKGEDEVAKGKKLEGLVQDLVSEDFADFDLQYFQGGDASVADIISALSIPPFGSNKRVVVVKHANCIDPAQQSTLGNFIPSIPASSCLILSNPAPEKVDGRVKKGSEVTGDISRAVRKVGEVLEFGKLKSDSAAAYVKELLASHNKNADHNAVSTLIQRAGTDSSVLASEIRKLVDYTEENKKITAADVLLVTSETPEEKIFKLIESISRKNESEAMGYLEDILKDTTDIHGEAPKVLSLIARQLRLIWQMRVLQSRKVTSFKKDSVPDAVKNLLPEDNNILDTLSRQSWMADRLSRQAKAFSREELQSHFDSVARADRRLKGVEEGMEDPRLVLELLVVSLSSVKYASEAKQMATLTN